MADLSIRKDFMDGVQEVFTTLFNDGVADGMDLFLPSGKSEADVYGECRNPVYRPPIKLVAQARSAPAHGQEDVEGVKESLELTTTYTDLLAKGVEVSTSGLDTMRRGVVLYHGTFYKVDNVLPKAYVEDVYLLYTLQCSEDVGLGEVLVLAEEPSVPDGSEDGDEGNGASDDGGLGQGGEGAEPLGG